jgi:signal transduction histidine kinase
MLYEARTVRHLRFFAVLGPLVLLVVVEIAERILAPVLSPWVLQFTVFSAALIVLTVFYDQIFNRLERLEQRLQRQNRELLELHAAGLVVSADLSLETVLQTIVEGARSLLGTRYGAISVVDADDRITSFVTGGIDHPTQQAIGDPPCGRGLLGVALHEGQRLRLEDIGKDPRSVGFPAGHPPMRSLLAVPVVCRVPYRGNLYVSEKERGPFTADDEDALVRFAAQAAVAIDNAYLYGQMRELGAARERLRIAHEMHDGLAQVLAYVNTKAQVVREYLRQGKSAEAQEHLEEFAEAARGLYGDVRQQILDLRTGNAEEKGLSQAIAEYAKAWRQQAGIEVGLDLPPALELPPEASRQLFRILQEAFSNVRKHSRATFVQLSLQQGEDGLKMSVADDGDGFDAPAVLASQTGRFGLKTMAERAEAIGALLHIHSRLGEGTRIEMILPANSSGKLWMDTPDANTSGR